MSTQDCYPLGWTGWISLQSKGLSRATFKLHVFIWLHRSELGHAAARGI